MAGKARKSEKANIAARITAGTTLTIREMKVLETKDGYRAMIMIDGQNSLLDKIFVHASAKRFSRKIEYIELYGVDPVTGEDRFEKYVP